MQDAVTQQTPQERRIYNLFRISVFLKGAHALLELVGGALLLMVSPAFIFLPQIIANLTQEELTEDPNDLIANFFLQTAHQLSISSELFAAMYLLSHGIIKIILVVALLKNKSWAYPWSIAVLSIFIAYQLYRFTHTHSFWLIALSVFDVVVLYLIWREYRIVKSHLQRTDVS